jgi:head-tail adaptor
MPLLRAGDLRHRLIVRRASEIPNGKGGYASDWSDIATVSAEVTGLDGPTPRPAARETVVDHALKGIAVYQVRIRWRDDLRTSDQLRATGSSFGFDEDGRKRDVNIRSINDPDGRREQLVIVADTTSTRNS